MLCAHIILFINKSIITTIFYFYNHKNKIIINIYLINDIKFAIIIFICLYSF